MGILQGVLDFRQTLLNQRNDLLNPLIMQQQQQRATQLQDQFTGALGMSGNETLPGQQQGGVQSDLGPARGLLADPRFQDNRTELNFAAGLLGNPDSQALGSQLINNIITSQQSVDTQQVARADELAKALQASQRAQQQVAIDISKETFDREQALEADFGTAMARPAEAAAAFRGLQGSLETRNPLALISTIFQLAKVFDPGARTVTEGDVTTVEGAFPLQSQLNASLAKLTGGSWDETAAANVMEIGRNLARKELETGETVFNNFVSRANSSDIPLNVNNVIGRYGLSDVFNQGIEGFLGTPSRSTAESMGLTSGRAPTRNNASVREQRGR